MYYIVIGALATFGLGWLLCALYPHTALYVIGTCLALIVGMAVFANRKKKGSK
jgi:hypothetical protein